MKTEKFDLEKINPLSLPELAGWKEKQQAIVKENPFIEVVDNPTYEDGKKRRTALVSARTTIEKQDKLIASKLKDFRNRVAEESQKLIDITKPHEDKQQESVRAYEAKKEEERQRKEEEERQRVLKIKNALERAENDFKAIVSAMSFESIEKSVEIFETNKVSNKETFDFEEFLDMYDILVLRYEGLIKEKVNDLTLAENQRLENERLRKEAAESAERERIANEKLLEERKAMEAQREKEAAEQAKKEAKIKKRREDLSPYIRYIRDYDKVMELNDADFDAELKMLNKEAVETMRFEAEQEAAKKKEQEEAAEKTRLLEEKLAKIEKEKADKEAQEKKKAEAEAEKKRLAEKQKADAAHQKKFAEDKKVMIDYVEGLYASFGIGLTLNNAESKALWSQINNSFHDWHLEIVERINNL